jgi:magnesium chelatase accessory protein
VLVDAATEEGLNWSRDCHSWPMSEASRFVEAAGILWHLQQLGSGPSVLLIHGTGASTHSWRGLAPLLAQRYSVLALDLPGHAFTVGTPNGGLSLNAISEAIATLLAQLSIRPRLVIGHSAGAAIAARMALDGRVMPDAMVSLNGALLPFDPMPGLLLAPLARILAAVPGVPGLFSWSARRRSAVERLIRSTGSTLDAEGVDLYWRLVRSRSHVAGVLDMMAHWDLAPLARCLPQLTVPLLQLVGSADRTVPPAHAGRVHELLPSAQTVLMPGLGHLAHEERPDLVMQALRVRDDAFGAT